MASLCDFLLLRGHGFPLWLSITWRAWLPFVTFYYFKAWLPFEQVNIDLKWVKLIIFYNLYEILPYLFTIFTKAFLLIEFNSLPLKLCFSFLKSILQLFNITPGWKNFYNRWRCQSKSNTTFHFLTGLILVETDNTSTGWMGIVNIHLKNE